MNIASLLALMHYKTFKGRMGEEDRLSVEVATMLRVATIEGRLSATWSHVPHEAAGKGKFAAIYMAKAKAMGLIKGSADYVFVDANGGGWIEAKTKIGRLTPEQKQFREWAKATGVRHAVCRSVEEFEDTLREWGMLV